jgi:hypothetical protein
LLWTENVSVTSGSIGIASYSTVEGCSIELIEKVLSRDLVVVDGWVLLVADPAMRFAVV